MAAVDCGGNNHNSSNRNVTGLSSSLVALSATTDADGTDHPSPLENTEENITTSNTKMPPISSMKRDEGQQSSNVKATKAQDAAASDSDLSVHGAEEIDVGNDNKACSPNRKRSNSSNSQIVVTSSEVEISEASHHLNLQNTDGEGNDTEEEKEAHDTNDAHGQPEGKEGPEEKEGKEHSDEENAEQESEEELLSSKATGEEHVDHPIQATSAEGGGTHYSNTQEQDHSTRIKDADGFEDDASMDATDDVVANDEATISSSTKRMELEGIAPIGDMASSAAIDDSAVTGEQSEQRRSRRTPKQKHRLEDEVDHKNTSSAVEKPTSTLVNQNSATSQQQPKRVKRDVPQQWTPQFVEVIFERVGMSNSSSKDDENPSKMATAADSSVAAATAACRTTAATTKEGANSQVEINSNETTVFMDVRSRIKVVNSEVYEEIEAAQAAQVKADEAEEEEALAKAQAEREAGGESNNPKGVTHRGKSKRGKRKRSVAPIVEEEEGTVVVVETAPESVPVPVVHEIELPERKRFPDMSGKSYFRYSAEKVELCDRVEYDIDEEDSTWLGMLEQTRGISISQEEFEAMMDRLEKESFFKESKEEQQPIYDDDAVCSVCLSGECANTNAILFCDACNLAVHQECYGVPFIPEGQWLCRRCLRSPSAPVTCVLCNESDGAFKECKEGDWAHVVCARFIPEVEFGNEVFLEPVQHVKKVPRDRWRFTCYLCEEKGTGACIQCYKSNCYRPFHPHCGQKAGLYMYYGPDGCSVYCHAHTPKDSGLTPLSTLLDDDTNQKKKKKKKSKMNKKQPSKKGHHGGSVSVPYISMDSITKIVKRISPKRKDRTTVAELIGAYWVLKRYSRHGVPLLRRLQASHANNNDDIGVERRRFQHLRQELEKARMLVGQTLRREKIKRSILAATHEEFTLRISPMQPMLRQVLPQLRKKDYERVFHQPVEADMLADYDHIVSARMDLSTMQDFVDAGHYRDVFDFVADFKLMCNNSLSYNPKGSWWHKYARDYLIKGSIILEQLVMQVADAGIDLNTGILLKDPPEPSNIDPGLGLKAVFDIDMENASDELKALYDSLLSARIIAHSATRTSTMTKLVDELMALQEAQTPVVPLVDDLSEEDGFRPGQFVWAKQRGFAAFPAEIVDPKVKESQAIDIYHVPTKEILRMRPEGDDHHLILFFDLKRTWSWLDDSKLKHLFIDDKYDAKMLKASKKHHKQVKDAYSLAKRFASASRGRVVRTAVS